jgi:hypothetical protein
METTADQRKQSINGYEYQTHALLTVRRYPASQQVFACHDPSPQRYLGE